MAEILPRSRRSQRAQRAQPIQILVDRTSGEKMPTDKIVDVSPLALRMSSPFNSRYWRAAA